MNVDFGEFAQISQTHSCRGIDQTARRRNNEHTGNSLDRAGKCIGIGKLAAKIKSAQKGEDFTQRRAFAAAQSPGEIELRSLAQNHTRPFATSVGGRKQKNAIVDHFIHFDTSKKMRDAVISQPRFGCE